MLQWLKDRWDILRSLEHPLPFLLLGFIQVAAVLLALFPPSGWMAPWMGWLRAFPGYGWIIGWLLVLWGSTLRYSVERKKRFDETSVNFFKAYVDFLMKDGHQLFHQAGGKDYYSKIADWQRKAVEGIAIGLGPEESKNFFQKVESKSPLSEAYRESTASKSGESLSRALRERLEELRLLRMNLPEGEGREKERGDLLASGAGKAERAVPETAGLLTGEVENPPIQRLPKN